MATAATYNSKSIRLSETLSEQIDQGQYPAGSALPTEARLASEFGVSRATIRRAIDILNAKGILAKEPGRGVWVRGDTSRVAPQMMSAVSPVAAAVSDVSVAKAQKTLAIAWAAEDDYRIVRMKEGVRRYCNENGLMARIFSFNSGNEQVLELLPHLHEFADGGIVLPYSNAGYEAALQPLVDRGFPLVTVLELAGLDLNSVETDNRASIYQATHYLIGKYGRPVHYLGKSKDDDLINRRCLEGYRSAMADAGLEKFTDACIHTLGNTMADSSYWPVDRKWLVGYEAAKKLLTEHSGPLSIVAVNNYLARGVYEAAAELNLRVGGDLHIASMDQLPMARLMDPPLTTTRSPAFGVGYEAARLLHELIQNPGRAMVHIHLPIKLIARQSA